jgi:hypothetical protein
VEESTGSTPEDRYIETGLGFRVKCVDYETTKRQIMKRQNER